MKCPRFGWSPAFWPQILCVSLFRACTDIPAIGRLCHSDSVWRLRRSNFFPLSHPWRATTGPECHRENECRMKIDAAFEFQEAWFTHLWAVDTIIPHVTLARRGHCRAAMALVTLGQPGESWSLFSAFPCRPNVYWMSCFVLGWGAIHDAGGEPHVGEETLLSLQIYNPAMICRDFILSLLFLEKISF